MLDGETLEPVFKVRNRWDAHSNNHYDLTDVTTSLEHQVNSAFYVPGKSLNSPNTLQEKCYYSHFTDEKIKAQRSNLPKVTLPGSDRTRTGLCAYIAPLGTKFLIIGDLNKWRLEDNFVRMTFPLNLLMN